MGMTTVADRGQGLFSFSGFEKLTNHDVQLGSWYSVTRKSFCRAYLA
jgi:hypothetical protein